jgi:hypothetical protein
MAKKGFFIIRPYDKKTVLKLEGQFHSGNIKWIIKAMMTTKKFNNRALELNFHDALVESQALDSIKVNVNKLKNSGMNISLTGLDCIAQQ